MTKVSNMSLLGICSRLYQSYVKNIAAMSEMAAFRALHATCFRSVTIAAEPGRRLERKF